MTDHDATFEVPDEEFGPLVGIEQLLAADPAADMRRTERVTASHEVAAELFITGYTCEVGQAFGLEGVTRVLIVTFYMNAHDQGHQIVLPICLTESDATALMEDIQSAKENWPKPT